MAVAQYLDKQGLKTLVKEINKRTNSAYVIKGSAIYADADFIKNKASITDYGDITAINSVGLWQKQSGAWVKITEVKIGWVYNIENRFKTDGDFLEGVGHSVEAGTNIVVVEVSDSSVKWDLLAMTLNLDPYQTKKLVNAISIFTATSGDPITVTVGAKPTTTTPADPKKYDVVVIDTDAGDDKAGDIYRYNGTSWEKIGDQVTVEGALELLSKVAPNTPISDAEIVKIFEDVESGS